MDNGPRAKLFGIRHTSDEIYFTKLVLSKTFYAMLNFNFQ